MTNININQTAQQIFANLNVRDGVSDNKIGKQADGTFNNSIWNSFADAAGGNHIKNYIEQGNALKSIRTYLQRAINDISKLTQIANAGGVSISPSGDKKTVQEQPKGTLIQSSVPSGEVPDDVGINAQEHPAVSTGPNAVSSAVDGEVYVNAESAEPQATGSPANTGGVVAVRNEDGTSYKINEKDSTITKFSADGQAIEQRAMTPEEQSLSTQDLITQLQASAASAVDNSGEEPQPINTPERTIAPGKGVMGSYVITDTGDGGYEYNGSNLVVTGNSQALKAFKSGFELLNLKHDKNGIYKFRGVVAKNISALQLSVEQTAKDIAQRTAVYKDLQAKQENGEILTPGEQKFMQDYNRLLQNSGLKINKNGELEDISS